jgi:hypothetical protein
MQCARSDLRQIKILGYPANRSPMLRAFSFNGLNWRHSSVEWQRTVAQWAIDPSQALDEAGC